MVKYIQCSSIRDILGYEDNRGIRKRWAFSQETAD